MAKSYLIRDMNSRWSSFNKTNTFNVIDKTNILDTIKNTSNGDNIEELKEIRSLIINQSLFSSSSS